MNRDMEEDDPAAAGMMMIPEGFIRRVKLSIASNDEILKAVPVTNPSEKPFPITHGSQLQDNPSLGLPLQVGSCDSCAATQLHKCQGHFGFIELPVPIYHPSHITELGKILNMICLCCLRLKNGKLKRKGTGKESKFTSCSYCQDLPPLCVSEAKKSNGARSLKLTAPLRAEVGDGFWSFLDQFGFHTTHRAHSRPLLPKEGSQHITLTRQPASKQWLQKMKTLFISKSSSFSCRAVITGDPYIGLDVVGVPDEVARRISVEEQVTDYNIARLQDIMDKGLCLTYRDINSKTYDMDVGEANDKKRTILRVGETVNRRVLDGDVVFLNRPPSTDMHSVEAFYVHIHEDHTIKINPLICGPLGADFDGDCVHIFYPRSVSARVEAKELFTVENQLMSSHNAKLNFQLKNDCLLALKTMCDRSKSVVQFESRGVSRNVTPGDSVGILAATAVANAAYKAVLDPNQNNITSWDSMKELLLTKSGLKNDINDRKVILYLNKYTGVINAMQSCLKKTKVEDCTTEISISECFCDEGPGDEKYLQVTCFKFFLDANIATELPESTVVHLMTNTIFPILLETIIKGDPRIQKAKIIWIEPSLPWWVQNSSAEQKGELALEVTVEKDADNGNAWGVAMDACIPVMHLIDTTRSIPYSIQRAQQVFGISFAFDRITQHLSKAIEMVTKSVLKEHLITVASSMTSTGTQNLSIQESSAAGEWNRNNSTFGRGGSRAMWKSEGSHHGGSNSRNWKAQKNSSARQGGSCSFTPVEQQIYAQVDPIMKNAKRIIRESRDGIKLSPEDECSSSQIFSCTTQRGKRRWPVSKHQKFHSSRCLYVASSNGSCSDFSYKKCLENFVRIRYPAVPYSRAME
ncbi:hypothetical protein PR202_ga08211 [Eleusine coracana subsp. coracana]|uniref:DNA-directed RNA polymerase n=1 Tax=Eleusine coracana subsp. coracana TaxID=191504 RepID=A0AAV5BZF6_ELECO|nr:hypothetical protein PR202_ga08211 [Eleusine coracana subsp. coracana]